MHCIMLASSLLRARQVLIQDSCDVCGEEGETLFHVFFHCLLALEVWSKLCPWVDSFIAMWTHSSEFLSNLMIKAQQVGNLELTLVALWTLWYNRNKSLHDGCCYLPSNMITMVESVVSDFDKAMLSLYGELRLRQQ